MGSFHGRYTNLIASTLGINDLTECDKQSLIRIIAAIYNDGYNDGYDGGYLQNYKDSEYKSG